jgi:hypothetical protein
MTAAKAKKQIKIGNKQVRNIVWAIQAARTNANPGADVLLRIFETTAMRWLYGPMIGHKNLSVEEIAKMLEEQ